MNFIEKVLDNKFERYIPDMGKKNKYSLPYDIKNGWYGVTVYHPDEKFIKGDKEVILSLSGALTIYYLTNKDNIENKDLLDAMAAKMIVLKSGNKIVYKTVTGILPSNELLDTFLKD